MRISDWSSDVCSSDLPFAVGRRDRRAFGVAAIWENWKNPKSGDWTRTFAVITCQANDLVARIHNRMPVLVGDDSLERWLSPTEVDPRDLTVPFPSAELRVWRVSSRVNTEADDEPAVLDVGRAPRRGRVVRY